MKFLILANGEYGELDWYRKQQGFDRVICADAGALMALQIGIEPQLVIGDLDSIGKKELEQLKTAGCRFLVYPVEKDYTDTHLALMLAEKEGATEVTVWGGTGSRLDHTLGSIFSAAVLAEQGIAVRFASPAQMIYLVCDELRLPGCPGETVSVMALVGRARGVTLEGFYYPLSGVTLETRSTLGVSNVITTPDPVIRVEQGILTVFHYPTVKIEV
jgi:thiamine pyrophosphokinase